MNRIAETLTIVAAPWGDAIWAASWQSSLLALLVLLVVRTFKGMPPAIRYWLWMIVGLRLLVMPLVTMEFAIIPVSESPALVVAEGIPTYTPAYEYHSAIEVVERVSGSVEAPVYQAPRLAAAPPSTPLSWKALIMLLWGTGVAIVLARLGWTCVSIQKIIAHSRFGDRRMDALAARAGALYSMSKPPRTGVSDESTAPFVYGVWQPVVILPESLVAQATDEQLVVVLAHEYAHVQRRDPLLGWAFAFCHALYFFHPVLPFVKRQLLFERERACDDWVLSLSKARPCTYARVLVAVAALCSAPRQIVPLLVTGESFQDLKERLRCLGADSGSRPRIRPAAALMLAILAILAAPGVAFTQQKVGAREMPAPITVAADETTVEVSPTGADTLALVPVASAQKPRVNGEAAPRMRVLRFPTDRVVGKLQLKDRSVKHYIDRYWYWNDDVEWAPAGAASGTIMVPEDKLVWLMLNEEGNRDTSFLRELRQDDIYRLGTLFAEEGGPSLDDRGMEDVATLTGLRHLELRYSQVSDRGLALLEKLPLLERLQTPSKMTDVGLAHIARLSTLQGLYINQHNASDAGLAEVAKLQDLRELSLGGTPFTGEGLIHLAALPKLEYLMFSRSGYGDDAMPYVARIPNLTTLNAARQSLTNRGVQELAKCPRLETLSLYGVQEITGIALKYLAEMKTLRRLDLGCPAGEKTRLNSYSLNFLAKSKSLEALDAPRDIDDNGLAYIAEIPNLRELSCGSGSRDLRITDAGIRSVTRNGTLLKLSICGGGITDDGLKAIAGLRDLETLSLLTDSEAISNDGIAALGQLAHLKDLMLYVNKRSGASLAGLTQLNTLTKLTDLKVTGFKQDDSVLDLSSLTNLRKASFYIVGGFHDEDLACFAQMNNLRWLQGLNGISDAGVDHITTLTQLDRVNIGGDAITDSALEKLKPLRALDTLGVSGNFTDSGIQELRALPGLHWLTLESATPLSDAAQERLIAALPNLTSYNQAPLAGAGG